MTILQIDSIHKSFGKTKALNGIHFSVPEGAIFGILGPNGSGKTTLLSIILDILKADSGQYAWFGTPPTPEQRGQIGTLLETPNFYHYLSAVQNLRLTAGISGRGSDAAIETALKKVGLYDRRHSRFSTYSLGMKQRLAIGVALLGEPSTLILDEPTNGLDPVGIAEIRELILALKAKGHTVIIASHLLDEVEKVCTHVAIMKYGDLLSCGPVDEILSHDDQVEIAASDMQALQSAIQSLPALQSIKLTDGRILLSLPKNAADMAAINRHCFRQGVELTHLYFRKQRLESRFFELTQN